MGYMIRELPSSELPRERLMKYGVKSLSNEELLSILLRTGTKNKSVKELSLDILKKYKIEDLNNLSYNTLASIKGVGKVKAVTILAALELGNRTKNYKDIKHITSSNDAYLYAKSELEDSLQEKFMAIYLDTRNNIITSSILFIGTVNQSFVYPRDVFREAVKNNANSIILLHNHPVGSMFPSNKDLEITNVLIDLGNMMGIKILDHIIICKDKYYSFKENKNM